MTRIRVLIVEDTDDDVKLADLELRRAGYQPTIEHVCTREAMRNALVSDFDVVLSDYRMPRFDALSALEVLRSLGKDLPFIIVSGSIGEETAVEALKAGATDYVLKSNMARLGAAVERSLKEFRTRRERDEAIDRLQKAVQARDQFLSVASHELKTPVTSLLLRAQALLRSVRSESRAFDARDIEQRLVVLEENIHRLARLINQLLDITRMSSGRLTLERQSVDATDIVRRVVERMEDVFIASRSPVQLDVPDALTVHWDPERFDTLLTNLLSNAAKYGAGNPISVSLEDAGGSVRLRVRDEGIGIDPRDQQRIFGRFERAVSNRNYPGFGVGLWIVRDIAEAHGGTVEVQSQPGSGATFAVVLPKADG